MSRQFYSYRERGAPVGVDDGTIAPSAAVAAMPFTPDASLRTLTHFINRDPSLLGQCGLYAGFNETFATEAAAGWTSKEWVGIDQGPVMLMVENFRSEFVWEVMRKDPVLLRGLRRAGFEGRWLVPTAEEGAEGAPLLRRA